MLLSIENLLSYERICKRVDEGSPSLHARHCDTAVGNLCVKDLLSHPPFKHGERHVRSHFSP